tara:strand:- start:726 stop:887 length:162 start_codon:yes stop_codon:yes gene_type:complete
MSIYFPALYNAAVRLISAAFAALFFDPFKYALGIPVFLSLGTLRLGITFSFSF